MLESSEVGSILHDLCCMEHQSGAFCHGSNYPIGATINALGNTNNDCACLMEWRKAAWNVLRGRLFPLPIQFVHFAICAPVGQAGTGWPNLRRLHKAKPVAHLFASAFLRLPVKRPCACREDMTPVPSLQRKSGTQPKLSTSMRWRDLVTPRSYLPKGSGTNYESYKSTWGLTERTRLRRRKKLHSAHRQAQRGQRGSRSC